MYILETENSRKGLARWLIGCSYLRRQRNDRKGMTMNSYISLNEKMPEYSQHENGMFSKKILCYCEADKTVHLAVSEKSYFVEPDGTKRTVFKFFGEDGSEIENVSHWCALPEPPRE